MIAAELSSRTAKQSTDSSTTAKKSQNALSCPNWCPFMTICWPFTTPCFPVRPTLLLPVKPIRNGLCKSLPHPAKLRSHQQAGTEYANTARNDIVTMMSKLIGMPMRQAQLYRQSTTKDKLEFFMQQRLGCPNTSNHFTQAQLATSGVTSTAQAKPCACLKAHP